MLNNKQKHKITTKHNKIISCFNKATLRRQNSETFKDLNLLKFEDLINMELGKLMYKVKTNALPHALSNLFPAETHTQTRYNTRNANIPNIRRLKSKQFNNGFLTKTYTNWVPLDTEIKNAKHLGQFKNTYKIHVLSSYTYIKQK